MVSYLDDQSFISKCYHVLLFIIPSQGDNQWSVYDFFDHQEFCNIDSTRNQFDCKIFACKSNTQFNIITRCCFTFNQHPFTQFNLSSKQYLFEEEIPNLGVTKIFIGV